MLDFSDNQLLRQMIGAYLLRPDPIAWQAAADIFEERGDAETAYTWRRRAKWYPLLLAAYARFREAGELFKRREYVDLGSRFTATLEQRFTATLEQSTQRTSVYVTARLRAERVFMCQSVFWGLGPKPWDRETTVKIMSLINKIIAWEKANPEMTPDG